MDSERREYEHNLWRCRSIGAALIGDEGGGSVGLCEEDMRFVNRVLGVFVRMEPNPRIEEWLDAFRREKFTNWLVNPERTHATALIDEEMGGILGAVLIEFAMIKQAELKERS
jgi:hypothetical protein